MLATEPAKQILIVDRDVAAVEPLRLRLNEVGFVVRAITDASAARSVLAERPPDLVIIDWNITGFAALEVIQGVSRARLPQSVRLIILSALTDEQDVIAGFNMGADDYISKPFSVREVVARVAAVLRCNSLELSYGAITCDNLVLEVSTNRVTANGQSLSLRGVEYRLLEFFMSHRGKTYSRAQLLTRVWGDDSGIDERTVDVNVQRLRKTLTEPGYGDYIQTVRGYGYRFGPPSPVRSG